MAAKKGELKRHLGFFSGHASRALRVPKVTFSVHIKETSRVVIRLERLETLQNCDKNRDSKIVNLLMLSFPEAFPFR